MVDELGVTGSDGPAVVGELGVAGSVGPVVVGGQVAGASEPVAVVGVGCRLPGGVSGPGEYWRFLLEGVPAAIREVPDGRWDAFDDGSLDEVARLGGFLDDIAGFDSRFFGITPEEADVMDPRQRLMLEVAWEALEHAGVAPASLRGSRTGVFVGVSAPEAASGASLSVVAERLSYVLGLRGPSVGVDTGCLSSLEGARLAVRSLRDGESDLAVVGGVNVLLSPMATGTLHPGGTTVADGRCEAVDVSADGTVPADGTVSAEGTVRAEGCGALVLKRLFDARRDGDRVLALIHGTAVYSGEDRPVVVGSIEFNLGRLEPAAGVAGLIRVVLALSERRIPLDAHHTAPGAHHIAPNPPHTAPGVHEDVPWPESGGPAVAGVSGFGGGGGGVHLVLGEAPAEVQGAGGPGRARGPVVHTFLLSDVEGGRIGPYAAGLAHWLETTDTPLSDVARTLSRRFGRGHAAVAVVGRDRASLASALRAPRIAGVTTPRIADVNGAPAHIAGTDVTPAHIADAGVSTARFGGVGVRAPRVAGVTAGQGRGPVWVFSGYGAQRAGMGRRLLVEEPVFAGAIEEIDGLVAAEAGFSLAEVLESGERVTGVFRTMTTLFGLQMGLATLLRSYGAEPGAVVGHSMGEVAAAVTAGALSLADGVKVITRRSRLLDGVAEAGGGAMLVLGCDAVAALGFALGCADVHVAVRSSARQTVLAGDAEQLARVAVRAEEQGLPARLVQVEGAGHSPAVDPILDPLRAELAGLRTGAADVPFYSTVLNDPRQVPDFDGDYWAANTRRAVRLADAIAAAADDGFTAFVEVNAHPLVAQAIGETVEGALVVPLLRRAPRGADGSEPPETDDTVTFHEALATLTVHGLLPAPTVPGRVADVPMPPWEHRWHWVREVPSGSAGHRPLEESYVGRRSLLGPDGGVAGRHPLLGPHVELPGEDRHAWSVDVGPAMFPWGDRPDGGSVLPAVAYAEIVLAAGAEVFGPDVTVSGLRVDGVLPIGEHTTITISLTVGAPGAMAGAREGAVREDVGTVEVYARTAGSWTLLASAVVSRGGCAGPTGQVDARPVDDSQVGAGQGMVGHDERGDGAEAAAPMYPRR
ncbi:type I polyketide synthase [Sphaerisporangium corydalis]|uniref:Acyltransferase domain-containing protein n=1 Tax=Sphaerisporangium corydalis TaxID=1441875 RepID=A0ABV9EBK8_9ACTN|nr:type I polyketide synthase [Sphaerisporangium corydalis]